MEFVSAIVGPVVESLLIPIKKHMGYLISSTSYVGNMRTRMKQLDGIGVDISKRKVANNIGNLEIPARVRCWLEEVEKIKGDVESISNSGSRCFNVKMRYKAGKRASNVTREIERLIEENRNIVWTDCPKPLGKVNSEKASASAPLDGDTQNDFKSRDKTFKEALEFLQPNHDTQMIAICGMGGVGKTTMVDQLKKAVEDKKMFDWIIKAVIGQKTDPVAVQQGIAQYMGLTLLTETSKEARADRLRKGFEGMLGETKKILVILDDVWWTVDLKDIGLSPLPNGVKLLLTSRDENVCTRMTAEANLIFKVVSVDVLEEPEAHNFFRQIAGVSEESDPERNQIGGDIVRRCGFLPLAIKLIATTLKSQKEFAWRTALHRLKMNDLDQSVHEIINISYNYLKEDAKAIFLLCGLFPDDSDIPIEELTRYTWGLELLDKAPTLLVARDWTETLVHDLQNGNLLITSDRLGCVKMHDLVLTFVRSVVSEGKHTWLGDMSKWNTIKMTEPYKRISLTCRGMSEFPGDHNYPNLSLLKLMHGDRSLKFPEDFYGRMEMLQVIAYEGMCYPLLPGSLQCSTNLRTLCLHLCFLMDEFSHIGNLMNLEILSFAHCRIRKLPSTIGNLKKLRLLDLTGCVDLRIDDGVLGKLVCLEELYMRVANEKAIRFTDANCNELVKLSSNLSALEVEFFENKAEPKKVCFKNLKRFRISMGRYLEGNWGEDMYSFENTLMLDTNRGELLESRINELFDKTKVLHLKVNGMNDLEDVLVESLHRLPHSFHNLRELIVFECANLRYLFTLPVATGLSKLEHLTISSCPILEELVHVEDNREEKITFQKLESLSLDGLPKLVSLCKNVDAIELLQLVELRLRGLPGFTSIFPKNKTTTSVSSNISATQSFFNEKVAIPKLEKLEIRSMENLKEIWLCQFSGSEEVNICRLREIRVEKCDGLINLFPTNPMPWLLDLEFLHVRRCGSIEAIFDMDMGRIHEIEQGGSSLRRIELEDLGKLREVWRMKGVNSSHPIIHGFQAVKNIYINRCKSFRNLFIPTTANFDLGAVEDICINGAEPWGESGKKNELVESSTSTDTPGPQCNIVSNGGTSGVEVVFEIRSASNTSKTLVAMENNQQLPLLPQLKFLHLWYLERMSHVWKCNWNIFLFPQQQQQLESPFHNLTNIELIVCESIKYLFSPLMAKLLPNLKEVKMRGCKGIEEVVSNRDDEDEEMSTSTSSYTNTAFFPHFKMLYLERLPRLKRIGGNEGGGRSNEITSDVFQPAQVAVASWSLCQYARNIRIFQCNALPSVIPSHAVGQLQKLEKLEISDCESMVEVFETQGTGNIGGNSTNVGEGSGVTGVVSSIPRMKNMNLLELPNLKILKVVSCDHLRHIFTYSTLESLKQLEELEIEDCEAMQVIVKEEDGKHTTSSKDVVFPCLKSLRLINLPNLKGFFLGMNDFQWLSLDMVKIDGCPQMMVFTSGRSTTPKLNYIHTSLGKHSLECGLNFHVTTTTLHETRFLSLDSTTSEGMPWSFSNLIDIDGRGNRNLDCIIPSHGLLQLQKLEKINVHRYRIEEVFEAFKGTNSGLNESHFAVKFPKLREVNLYLLESLKYIWKSNQWTVLEFPSLTRVSISHCSSLEHVFTCSMVGSLLQLQELHIFGCENMEVIVKETEDSETRVKKVVFPCLKSLKLEYLRNLKGFCLGKEDFMWPSLDTLEIKECFEITVFTNGQSTTPELKVIDTSFGMCYAREDPNSFIKTKRQEGFSFGSVHGI